MSKESKIILKRYNSYGRLYTFDYDISSLNFYSEIRNSKKELIATFVITKDSINKKVLLSLTEPTITAIEEGEYFFDVKQVSNSNSSVIDYGKVIVTSGVTQAL